MRRDDKTRGLTYNGTFGSSWPNIQPLYNHHKIMLIIISFFFPLLAFLAGRIYSKILARQRKSIEKITIFPTRMGSQTWFLMTPFQQAFDPINIIQFAGVNEEVPKSRRDILT